CNARETNCAGQHQARATRKTPPCSPFVTHVGSFLPCSCSCCLLLRHDAARVAVLCCELPSRLLVSPEMARIALRGFASSSLSRVFFLTLTRPEWRFAFVVDGVGSRGLFQEPGTGSR